MTSARSTARWTNWPAAHGDSTVNAELFQFAGSLAAVVALVALAWVMGFRQSGNLASEAEARDLFRLAPGGFEPVEIGLDDKGSAAIARDAEGRLAVLVAHGNQFVVRPVEPGQLHSGENGIVRVTVARTLVSIELGEAAACWTTTDTGDN